MALAIASGVRVGLLNRLSNWLAEASPMPPTNLVRTDPSALAVRGAYDPDRLPDWISNRSADWSPWDDRAKLAVAIGRVTAVFACATYLADAVAESPIEVYRTQPNGETDPATDRVGNLVRDLFLAPNPYTSESEFFLTLVLGMCVCGYGAIEKVRMKGNLALPVELWTLRPDWLVRRRRMDGGEAYWEYPTPDGKKRAIEDRDVVIVPYYPDPWRTSYGISPAQVAAREIGIDASLTDFLKTFLDAGGIPPFVLTHPDPIYDETVITEMQTKWRQKYGGAKAYGSLPILHGGYDIKPVGTDLNAMAWPDLRGLTEQKIAQAHRVPLELIQGQMALTGGPLTSTQFEGAMAVLQRYGAAPLRSRIDAALTRGVLAEFTGDDPSYELAFDTSGILALQEDHDALHARVRADVGGVPLMTLNEGRRAIGLDEIEGGDVFAVPFNTTLTPLTELATPTTTTTAAPVIPAVPAKSARVYRDTKALSPRDLELRASSLDRTRRDRNKLTEIGARALRKFWVEQGQRITQSITGKSITGQGITGKVADQIDWPAEEKALAVVLLRFYNANGETAFATISDLFGVSIDWSLANPNVQRVTADLARRIVGIAETTRADVARIVTDSLTEGVTTQELADRLTGLFAETYKGRSLTVARTESQVAYNRASVIGYRETGQVDECELADSPTHCDDYGASDGLSCCERNGLKVALDAVDLHINAEHPNGSLAVIPIVKEA